MGATQSKGYAREVDSGSWEEKYSITTNADKLLVHEVKGVVGGVSKSAVIATYFSSGAINTADYNGFPIGTIIINTHDHKTYEKSAATTWIASAARS